MHWLYLSLAILAEVIATSFLKASDGFTRLVPSLVVVVGYAAAFFFLSLTLRTMAVGVAYAVWSGVGVVLITVLAWLFYGQKLDIAGLLGIGLIAAGVVVLQVFSRTTAQVGG